MSTAAQPPVIFSADEHDAVTELMNLGVGKAAAAFSRLVGGEVLLSVPDVAFTSLSDAEAVFAEFAPEVLAGVMQRFDGFINGAAALFFPGERSLELVRAVIGDDAPADEISDLEEETLAEIGNIILNNCLATLANVLGKEIHTSLPETYAGAGANLLSILCGEPPPEQRQNSTVLLVKIDFTLKAQELQGYLAFAIDLHSADGFRSVLAAYLADLGL